MEKRKSRIRICDRCGKREFTYSKSELCRHCCQYEFNKKTRKERVKNKCCAQCGAKIKPKIIIPYRCDSCIAKNKNQRIFSLSVLAFIKI